MRRLRLVEFRRERAVPLSAAERDAIRRVDPDMRIEPAAGKDGAYDLIPDQHIGVIAVPGLVVEVRPKIEMSAVLFLVSYALERVRWSGSLVDLAPDADLVDMIAILFARMVEQATRRGLLTGYQSEDEPLAAPRGRVRFDEQVRRRQGLGPPIEVRHDVFTTDILENRMLLAALTLLARVPRRVDTAKRELSRAGRLLGGVSIVPFRANAVPEVAFTRLNRHYEPAIALARLILQSAALDLGTGGATGTSFLVDMNEVFERFLRTALRTSLKADAQAFPEHGPITHLDESHVIPIKPDLCLLDRRRAVRWVGDAKYKRLPARAYQNADIYQLLAYTIAHDLPVGTLIYAADTGVRAAEHVIVRSGKRLEVVTLDLSAPPSAILRQVDGLARRITTVAQYAVA